MNKISPLDIRVAVLVYPLVSKEDTLSATPLGKPVAPYSGDERMISLFQNSPKARFELDRSNVPLILRKGQLVIFRVFEILKVLFREKERSTILDEVYPPRQLWVPKLPHPPFQTSKPPRFFWHPAYISPKDEYAPSCLMSEAKEDRPKAVFNSFPICDYARKALPKKGVLRQDHEGFVYLELPDRFVTDIFPLIRGQHCEAVPLSSLEPSPAHIPVILPHEWDKIKGWGEIDELEKAFSFDIVQLVSLKPKRWPQIETVYFFEIESQRHRKLPRAPPSAAAYPRTLLPRCCRLQKVRGTGRDAKRSFPA